MPSADLSLTLIQPDIVWEDKGANLAHYTSMIEGITDRCEVVLLPEMFSTGFSMAPERLAEPMSGDTVSWMKALARQRRIILAGSLIIEEGGQYFNRFLWVQPDGVVHSYDKRHLFAFAGEDAHYSRGEGRVVVQVKGWKILLQVCYDLRFPVWARNRHKDPYDLLLYVANWPERRSAAWNTLLPARAIENQCYVAGVNRVGQDGKGNSYSGDSALYDAMGNILWKADYGKEAICTIVLSANDLARTREALPFLRDGDDFMIL
jgi:predicted amidohydrolase